VRDHDAVDVGLLEQFGHALAEFEQALVIEALGADLEDLLALDVGHLRDLGHRGDDLVHRHYGGLIRRRVGGGGARAGDGAAGADDDDVRLAGFGGGARLRRGLGRRCELGVGGSGQQRCGYQCGGQ